MRLLRARPVLFAQKAVTSMTETGNGAGRDVSVWCGRVLTDTPSARAVGTQRRALTLRGGPGRVFGACWKGKLLSLSSGPRPAALEGSWCSGPFESLCLPD